MFDRNRERVRQRISSHLATGLTIITLLPSGDGEKLERGCGCGIFPKWESAGSRGAEARVRDRALGSDGKVVLWCTAQDEGEAARRIGGHRLLQVEGFERNVAADAVRANVFEVTIR